MKTKRILALVLSFLLILSSFGTVAFADEASGASAGSLNGAAYIESNAAKQGASGISGEASGVVGTESFVVKFFKDAAEVGSTTLDDPDKVLLNGVSKSISWHTLVGKNTDSYWKNTWVNGKLTLDTIPDTAELWVDGVKVDACAVSLDNAGANPIFAAVTDEDGYVTEFLSGTGYTYTQTPPSYDDAFNTALAEGGNITLLRDITLDETLVVPEGKTVVLDLNGKTIDVGYQEGSTTKHIYAIDNKGDLTLMDSAGGGSIIARGIYNGYNGNAENAKLTINSGKYVGIDTDGGAAIYNGAELVINGGELYGAYSAVNNVLDTADTTINGGTFGGAYNVNLSINYVILNNKGTLSINNANIVSGWSGIACYGGTVVISDGTFMPTGWPEFTSHVVYVAAAANVTIAGGTFKMNYPADAVPDSGEAVASYYGGTLSITGGNFYAHFDNVSPVQLSSGSVITGGTYMNHSGEASNHSYITNYVKEGYELGEDGSVVETAPSVESSLSGSGTEEEPYLINTLDDLKWFRDDVNGGNTYDGKYVELTGDINLSGIEWTPIGTGTRSSKSYSGNAFKGIFDGKNKTISGLTITSTTGADDAVGLFGVVDGGTVKDLKLTDVNINVSNGNLVGGVIGLMVNNATADNITLDGAIIGNDGVGGIVGRMIISGTISNCTNNASVTSSYGGIGGIVGKAYYEDGSNTSLFASISGCTNNGTITAPMYVGGIVGLTRSNVSGCVNNGAVNGGTQTGGIIGQLIGAGKISDNENKARISGKNHMGGVIGDYTQSNAYTYYNVSIENNINRGELDATEQCAAIMGCNNIDGFTDMTASGNVSYYYIDGMELFGNPEDMIIDETNKFVVAVAKIGDVEYTSLEEAVNAVKSDGGTLKLLANGGSITINDANKDYSEERKPITIDLNGYVLSSGESTLWVSDGYDVTVTDSSEEKTGKIISSNAGGEAIAIARGGKVTLESGYVYNPAYAVYLYAGSANGKEAFTMNGGTVVSDNDGITIAVGSGNVTINGGKVIVNKTTGGWAAYVWQGGKLDVKGGSIYGALGEYNGNLDNSIISVSGGTFGFSGYDALDTRLLADDYTTKNNDDGTVSVIKFELTIDSDGWYVVSNYEELVKAFKNDNAKVRMTCDITGTATQNSGYGVAGICLDTGDILDGGNNRLTINGANSTWDCAIAMRGGEVKNLTISGAMRGVFMPGANGDVLIDNCVFDGVVYTFNSDAGSTKYSVTIKNSVLNGWTSYSNVHNNVIFEKCDFGEGSGNAYLRPYQPTSFTDCNFAEGYEIDTSMTEDNALSFEDCTYDNEPISAENAADLFYNGGKVLVDGVSTNYTRCAQIGEGEDAVKFTSLEAAINSAADGDTITLCDDVELEKAISFTKDITLTIDGAGFSIKPAEGSTETNSAFNLGQGSDATVENKNYTIKNIVFDGWNTDHVLRLQGVKATVADCQFVNCKQPDGLGLLTLTYCEATVTDCVFKDNTCVKAIDVNANANKDGNKAVMIDGCTFENNDASSAAIIEAYEGTFTIKNSKFVNNKALSAAIFCSTNATISGNYFAENTYTGTKGNEASVLAGPWVEGTYAIEINGNAFADASVPGTFVEDWSATYNVKAAYNLDGNYWNGGEPNYKVYGNPEITLVNYYTTYDNNTLGGLTTVAPAEEKLETELGYVNGLTRNYNGTDYYQVYLFGGIDSLSYENVGYEVIFDGTTYWKETKTVYTGVKAGNGDFEPTDFGDNCKYIIGMEVLFPKIDENADASFTYRVYATKHDGQKVYSDLSTETKVYE